MTRKILRALSLLLLIGGTALAQLPAWTTATHLSAPLNSANTETSPSISKDGLSLYFVCDGCGGITGNRIYVSRRASVNDPWGTPESVGSAINDATAFGPFISADGQRLYFTSDRNTTGSRGDSDIWVSRWDGSAWGTPENLGDGVNSSASEDGATVFDDPTTGKTVLFFFSNRPGGTLNHIFTSTMQDDGTFGPAVLVPELSSAEDDKALSVRQDGLEIFITSNRGCPDPAFCPGSILNLQGKPSYDIWTSTRASASDPWSKPVSVDPQGLLKINSQRHDGGPKVAYDGMTLYFQAAQRPENIGKDPTTCPNTNQCFFDIWMTTRPDVTPPNPPTPHVAPAPNAAGWNNSDAVVSFTSNGDAGPIFSGVASCSPDVSLSDDTSGTPVSGTCTDNAGNVSEPASVTVKVDKTAPSVAVTGISEDATYLLGNVPSAGCSSADSLSGLATGASLAVSGGTANGVGIFTATCSGGQDRAGNVAAPVTATYNVQYAFGGFFLEDKVVNAGRMVPVKFRLRDARRALIRTISSVLSLQASSNPGCSGVAGVPFPAIAAGHSTLRFDDGHFIFNWKTEKSWTGCYNFLVNLDDGTTHATLVTMKSHGDRDRDEKRDDKDEEKGRHTHRQEGRP